MKTKLEMAHEFTLDMIKIGYSYGQELLDCAWQYADAMQAEAEKREKQNKDEFYANLADPMKKVREQEWQPDWSQAPADACCWFIGGKSWDVKPYWSKYIPCYKNEETQTTWQGDGMIEAPSFGYQGDWRNSLRKRPQ